jgi:nucleotide-binding universal stress UspA family protein
MVEDATMIVVGIDGSEGSERALEFAAKEALLRKRGLRIVAAWHVPAPVYAAGGFMVPTLPATDFEDSMRVAAEREASAAMERHPGIVSELVVCEGNAAAALLEQSADAEMLVVGSRGLGGFAGLLLGSVGHQCAQHAHCPVVIIPAEGR